MVSLHTKILNLKALSSPIFLKPIRLRDAALRVDLTSIAKACGYPNAVCVDSSADLDRELEVAKTRDELSLIEVKCSIGAREDLGRPTTTALENKQNFMEYLRLGIC